MNEMISKIHPSNFTWQLWRGGTLFDLGVLRYQKEFIVAKQAVLRKFAIGYCKGSSLLCRPKFGYCAVMFQKDDTCFWTHLTIDEFDCIFRGK